ncbi:MAG: hypothetical protein AB1552_01890 [Nitrospirota bacterium]
MATDKKIRQKDILIFEQDREVLRFLKSFFSEKPEYSVRFMKKNEKILRKEIAAHQPDNQRYADIVSTFEDPNITHLRIDLQKYPEIRAALSFKKPVIIKDAQKDPLMKEVRDAIAPIGSRSSVPFVSK